MSMSSDANMVNNLSVRNRAVLVTSDTQDPLSVIAYDEEFTSADAYKALACVHLPVESYYEYYAVSVAAAQIPVVLEDDYYGLDYELDDPFEPTQGDSVILIITCEDDTELNITLTQAVHITAPDLLTQVPSGMFGRNVSVTIKLSKAGQTLSISSENDLSGSRVTSDKPLTLISGHECGAIPYNRSYCDKMVEQIPPTATWGNNFIVAPIAGRRSGYDIFKLIGTQDVTSIDINCHLARVRSFSLHKGEFRSMSIPDIVPSDGYCSIHATGPILLVQFSVGSDVDGVFEGDPFMVIIPPIEQYRSNYDISVFANTNGRPESYYVNLLLPDGVESSGMRINGKILDSSVSFQNVTCLRRYCGLAAQLEVSSGQYSLTHVDPAATFNAIVYWSSFRLGSGYFAGMTQKPLTRMQSITQFYI